MSDIAAGVLNVSKQYGTTRALADVSFEVAAGEIHALVGENGAGKSTLVRILGGASRPDQGRLMAGGREHHFSSPHDAIAAGIITIPQDLRLVPALSIAENIALGDPPTRRVLTMPLLVDRARMRSDALLQLAAFDFSPDPDTPVRELGFAEQQIVALAKALRRQCRLLILDEPTAALENREITRLFGILRRLQSQGTAIVYVSHRLEEIVELADRCSVLRDGRVTAVVRRGAFKSADLMMAMTGREIAQATASGTAPTDTLIEEAPTRPDPVYLRAGEIVGLGGLLGSGATTVLRRIFGLTRDASAIRVKDRPTRLRSPAAAIKRGIGFVPPSRRLGLIMNQSVHDNILLPSIGRTLWLHPKRRHADRRLVAELIELLDIRPRDPALPVSALSGGNQQKVVLAKWLARRVEILLLDEPTQGVDIAAKAQIHAILRSFAARGGGVLLSSSDLSELTALCDAVLVMRHGQMVSRIERSDGLNETRLHADFGSPA
jgi:ABC-type sugar transport system ATPase subunit